LGRAGSHLVVQARQPASALLYTAIDHWYMTAPPSTEETVVFRCNRHGVPASYADCALTSGWSMVMLFEMKGAGDPSTAGADDTDYFRVGLASVPSVRLRRLKTTQLYISAQRNTPVLVPVRAFTRTGSSAPPVCHSRGAVRTRRASPSTTARAGHARPARPRTRPRPRRPPHVRAAQAGAPRRGSPRVAAAHAARAV
jgi:hypothetical protein